VIGPSLKFWMSHDTGYVNYTDRVTIQISTDAGATWPVDAATFKRSYDELERWVEANGYKCSGPPIEVYSKKPVVVSGRTILCAKIMTPVRKA
jgi:hypothetical protein